MEQKKSNKKNITIIDCYTDEPAGLGVPPYLGTYPRYIYGACSVNSVEPVYLTIDDLRFAIKYNSSNNELNTKENRKTNISICNLTKNNTKALEFLNNADIIIVICGSHTPGKYLSAEPGTTIEAVNLIKKANTKAITVLCGPAASEHDSTHEGGKVTKSKEAKKDFDYVVSGDIELFLDNFLNNKKADENALRTYEELKKYTINESKIIENLSDKNIICEIELGRGCPRAKGCSFCTEWKRFKVTAWRDQKDITEEIKSLYDAGIKNFRLGRQSCFYSYKNNSSEDIEKLLSGIWKQCPEIKVLHIDNANPQMVITKEGIKITELICKYCTPQNIAAFGVESFDPLVQKQNNLNCTNDTVMKAIEIINKCSDEYDKKNNTQNTFLPGINILFGLDKETKKTHEYNMNYLTEILSKYKIRRLNIRSVSPLPGTDLFGQCGSKFLHKNKKFYWKWRNDIRQNFDFPMLQKVYPRGTVIKDVYIRMWDGLNSFGQQLGTYPIVCGVEGQRLVIGCAYDLEVIGHNLRSVVCKVAKH